MEGKAVQIIEQGANDDFRLTRDYYRLMEKVGNRKLSVNSIAGDMRTGKSFILTLLLQYMLSNKSLTWLKDYYNQCKYKQNKPAMFHWKGGHVADTKGILAWSEPFFVKNTYGEEVAILFLDCEGSYDPHASSTSCSKIFALSLFLSSVHLFNISKFIKANVIDQLQYFMEFSKECLDADTKSGQAKPFQSIWFLIRDWPGTASFPYGIAGGQRYVDAELMNPKDPNPEQIQRKERMQEAFENISGALFPPPGFGIMCEKVSSDERLDHHLESEFIGTVKELADNILASETIVVKKVWGSVTTGEQYIQFSEGLMKLLNSNKKLRTCSLVELFVTQHNTIVFQETVTKYTTELAAKIESSSLVDDLTEWHNAAMHEALDHYRRNAKRSGTYNHERKRLEDEMIKNYNQAETKRNNERFRSLLQQREESSTASSSTSEDNSIDITKTLETAALFVHGAYKLASLVLQDSDDE